MKTTVLTNAILILTISLISCTQNLNTKGDIKLGEETKREICELIARLRYPLPGESTTFLFNKLLDYGKTAPFIILSRMAQLKKGNFTDKEEAEFLLSLFRLFFKNPPYGTEYYCSSSSHLRLLDNIMIILSRGSPYGSGTSMFYFLPKFIPLWSQYLTSAQLRGKIIPRYEHLLDFLDSDKTETQREAFNILRKLPPSEKMLKIFRPKTTRGELLFDVLLLVLGKGEAHQSAISVFETKKYPKTRKVRLDWLWEVEIERQIKYAASLYSSVKGNN